MGFKIETDFGDKREKSIIPAVDFQHILCSGPTGSGKTASLILPTLEDRIQRGYTIIFFDHKGHEHKKVKFMAKQAGRLGDVVEIGKPHASYINLMAELDVIRLKEMITENGMSKDPYWANSAANLLEDLVSLLRRLHTIVRALKSFDGFEEKLFNILQELNDYGIDIYEKPSFQTLSKIIATPKKMLQFKELVSTIPHTIEEMLHDNDMYEKADMVGLRLIFGKILTLQKVLEASDRFTLSQDKSDTNSGNNAVLQHLDNTIASYAKKDYVNTNEYTITDLMQKNAIIIVDTQSFGDDVMKIFLESILKKAVMRLRTGSTSPMSVFIDEANRVLFPSIDLHSDVLREAKVELVIAIQNEEQMITKFSETVWNSIKLNVKHQYTLDIKHRISYNEGEFMFPHPILLDNKDLLDAEYSYYAFKHNQNNLKKHFLSNSDLLPEDFIVVYDLDMFEHESAVYLEGRDGSKYLYVYHGEEIVNIVRSIYSTLVDMQNVPIDDESDITFDELMLREEIEVFYDEFSNKEEVDYRDDFYYDYDEENDF